MEPRRCDTCNAGYDNGFARVVRCGTCIFKPEGNTKWKPLSTPLTKPSSKNGVGDADA